MISRKSGYGVRLYQVDMLPSMNFSLWRSSGFGLIVSYIVSQAGVCQNIYTPAWRIPHAIYGELQTMFSSFLPYDMTERYAEGVRLAVQPLTRPNSCPEEHTIAPVRLYRTSVDPPKTFKIRCAAQNPPPHARDPPPILPATGPNSPNRVNRRFRCKNALTPTLPQIM